MAKIESLPLADTLTGFETLPIVQNQRTKQVSMAALIVGITPSLQAWYKGDSGDRGAPGKNADEVARRRDFIASAGQTRFVLGFDYRPGVVSVYLNGLLLPAADYMAPGDQSITIVGEGLSAGDELTVVTFVAPASNDLGIAPYITAEMFGAGLGNDDTTALRNLAAYVNATPMGAMVWQRPGRLRLTGDVTFTQSITWLGGGQSLSVIEVSNDAQILCSYQGAQYYGSEMATWMGASIEVSGNHPGCPLRIEYARGTTERTVHIERFDITAASRGSSYKHGLELHNVSLSMCRTMRFLGDEDEAPITTVAAIAVTDDQSGSELIFDDIKCFYMQHGIRTKGYTEGLTFTSIVCVGVHIGLDNDVVALNGEPWIVIRNCHLNTENRGVRLRGIFQWIIESNSFYSQGSDGHGALPDYACVETDLWTGLNAQSRLAGNICYLLGGYKPEGRAFVFHPAIVGQSNVVVETNWVLGGRHAVYLDEGVVGVRVMPSNTFFEQTDQPVFNPSNDPRTFVSLIDLHGRMAIGHTDPIHRLHAGDRVPEGDALVASENLAFANSDRKGAGYAAYARDLAGVRKRMGMLRWGLLGGDANIANSVAELYTRSAEDETLAMRLGGVGTPEGVIIAKPGAIYTRRDGGPGTTLYVKESGTGATGWAAK